MKIITNTYKTTTIYDTYTLIISCYKPMKILLISSFTFILSSCATQGINESSLTDFVFQEESGQFGYRTAWSRVLNEPLRYNEPESAKEDFEQCKIKIKEHFIKDINPSVEIQLAFLVECMSESGWYWRAVPYGYVSSL